MSRLAKILGAALVFGGVVWAFAAFGDLAAGVPRWSAWLGPAAIVVGFPLLFLFGARHGEEVWEAGEWIEAGGTVRGVTSVEFGVRLRVRLSAAGTAPGIRRPSSPTRVSANWPSGRRGASVEALVRSNDKKVVEILSAAGEA